MTLLALSCGEREVVRRLMAACFEFFDDGEFHTRLGVEPADMRAILATWKNLEAPDDPSTACPAINHGLNDLLNGVGISDAQALAIAGVPRSEIDRIYRKWAAARGWTSGEVR